MKLAIVSHKVCWPSESSASGYATDGGFVLQMRALSELFEGTRVVVPCEQGGGENGVSPLTGKNLCVVPLNSLKGTGRSRRFRTLLWLIKNGPTIWREISAADAVHAPIPGDVGTIGMLFTLIQRKPLFVRHCGNWMVQRTSAERFWKWTMERYGGGRNVMLATGGAMEPPSRLNANIKWIFATSIREDQISNRGARLLTGSCRARLVIACRQEPRKGTDIVIESLPLILRNFPDATLDVVGGGSLVDKFRERAEELGLTDRVIFHGKVEQSRVSEILNESDIFCYPTAASEGFPKVVVEALSCGLPVITTRVSVLPQLIGGGCGVLLDSATPESLALAVSDLCSDPARYEEMSARALGVAKQFTLEKWREFIGENLRNAWGVESLDTGQ